jgi:hypothetical protein
MTYREKLIWAEPPVQVAGRYIKRYYVVPGPERAFEPGIEKAALDMLPSLLPDPDGTPPATFAVFHRGGDGAAYLVVYSWVWDNVLHARSAAAAQPVLGCPDDDPTHFMVLDRPWAGCTYELPPLLHERDAWVRHMLVPDQPDLDGYLADSMADGITEGRSGERV